MIDLLVENRDTAERSAQPLGIIFLELRVDRLQEGPNEGDLESRAHDRALVPDVADYDRLPVVSI